MPQLPPGRTQTGGLSHQRGRRFALRRMSALLAVSLAAILLSLSLSPAGAAIVGWGGPPPSALLTRSLPGPAAVATATGKLVALYHSPGASKPFGALANPQPSGQPLTFLVANTSLAPLWLEVRLPVRPDGSEAWIHGSSVTLAQDNYLVEAHLAAHVLVVFDGKKPLLATPVGVGRSVLPTPTGVYYIVDLLAQPDPTGEYGPYAFGLSAYSNVLYSFGGGPGEIGLHGTDEPTSVGANESHGCLRLNNAVITELAHLLPLGTPVVISS